MTTDISWVKQITHRGGYDMQLRKPLDFHTGLRAFYYVRALENPSCRWETRDAIQAGIKPGPDIATTIQERAWFSSIWYVPEKR